jgi:hypothetical protein
LPPRRRRFRNPSLLALAAQGADPRVSNRLLLRPFVSRLMQALASEA